jgi:hypothetical protein
MGLYDSSDSANLTLLNSEINMYTNFSVRDSIKFFGRYIDDGAMIVRLPQGDICQFVREFASFYPPDLGVTFNISRVQTMFLDTTFGIGHTTILDGSIMYHIYQKPFHTYSYTHFESNHPRSVFTGIIQTECFRYRTRSVDSHEYEHMIKLFRVRLSRCGYSASFINQNVLPFNHSKRANTKDKPKSYVISMYNRLHAST